MLKPEARLNAVILAQLNFDADEAVNSSIIKIHRGLLPISYNVAPAMYAKAFAHRTKWNHIHTHMRGNYMVVVGSDEKISMTFMGKLRLILKKKGSVTLPLSDIPTSYTIPMVTKMIKAMTKKRVLVTFKVTKRPKTYTWKLVDNSSKGI